MIEARVYGPTGIWLTLLRIAWIILAVSTAAIWIIGIGPYHQMAFTIHNTNGFADLRTPSVWRTGLHQLGLSPAFYANYLVVCETILAWPMYLIGVIIFLRKSQEWIGLFVSAVLVTFGTTGTNAATSALEQLYPAWQPVLSTIDSLGFGAFFILPYIFPDGRFVPRWTRWFVLIFILLSPLPSLSGTPLGGIQNVVNGVIPIALLVITLGAPIYRYRRVSSPEQRQQTKIVIFAMVLAVIVFAGAIIAGGVFGSRSAPAAQQVLLDLVTITAAGVAFALVPSAFGVAILRYRLWDIDVLINRALVYGSLTVSLLALYIGAIIGSQAAVQAITGGTSEIGIVLSTLLIAALVQPVRRRLQHFIDRRFYRRKYDAARTLASFQAKLRDEVELDRLQRELLAVVEHTMQPASVSLWLPERP
jgi:hypothetical protein